MDATVDRLIGQVIRTTRLMHRLKANAPGGSYDRSANILLLIVDRAGPMRVADLANTCHIDASTVSRQAADLVGEGLFRREADPEDGRASRLALTAEGERHVAELKARRRRFFQQVIADWQPREVDTFVRLLTRFADDVEQHMPTTSREEVSA